MTPDIGDRIRLIHTNDRYTTLKLGDLGSITDVTYLPEDYGGQAQIWVRWDGLSSFSPTLAKIAIRPPRETWVASKRKRN
jgi:hypothetical protein